MSKIYQALLQAEIDRVARLNGSIGRASEQTNLPSAGTVDDSSDSPVLPTQRRLSPDSLQSPTLVPTEGSTIGIATSWSPDVTRLPTLQTRGPAVEQFRVLRSRLSEMRFDHPLKAILVSSALPEEGKSFVAANLAIALAKFRDTKVLLVDGDMRRGTQHALIGTKKDPGLTDFLSGAASLDRVIQRLAVSEMPHMKALASLSFIPSGHDSENAADLSGNGVFQQLLDFAHERFDWVIVDSSPVTLVSDGTNLARHCDGVLFVARGDSTQYEVAQRALRELKAAKVLGVVLNGANVAQPAASYYGYGG